jgi:hypothetical protein
MPTKRTRLQARPIGGIDRLTSEQREALMFGVLSRGGPWPFADEAAAAAAWQRHGSELLAAAGARLAPVCVLEIPDWSDTRSGW